MSGPWARPLVRLQRVVTALAFTALWTVAARATELKSETVAAFNLYVHTTETRIARDLQDGHFLLIDDLPAWDRHEAYAQLQQGGIYIRHFRAEEEDKPIDIPHGLIHHWLGIVFIPEVTLAQTLAELQDYADQPGKYAPIVRQAKILEHNGNEFKIYRQYYHKHLVTVVINAEFDDVYGALSASRATIRSYSTRIAEVADFNQAAEHELPVGNDHGYVWRYYNYCHIEEKDSGVYVQVESVALSRTVPAAFEWLVNPLIQSIPRDVFIDLLSQTRKAVLNRKAEVSPIRRNAG
jgi:hypothetical protein